MQVGAFLKGWPAPEPEEGLPFQTWDLKHKNLACGSSSQHCPTENPRHGTVSMANLGWVESFFLVNYVAKATLCLFLRKQTGEAESAGPSPDPDNHSYADHAAFILNNCVLEKDGLPSNAETEKCRFLVGGRKKEHQRPESTGRSCGKAVR